MDNIIRQALNQFGVDEHLPYSQLSGGTTNRAWRIGEKYILKSYASGEEEAERVAWLNIQLFNLNAPVAQYHTTIKGAFYASAGEECFTLADRLEGASAYSIWDGDTCKRAFSLGKNLARLHLALNKLDAKAQAQDVNTMDELHGWILPEIRVKNIPVKPEVIKYCVQFESLYRRLSRQMIHRDPHSGNTLLHNDEITGFIDFDISQINTVVFDMCYAFSPNRDIFDTFLTVRPHFFSGYNSVSPVSADMLAAYTPMCVLIELLFTAFYSTQNSPEAVNKSLNNLHWLYNNRDKIEYKM